MGVESPVSLATILDWAIFKFSEIDSEEGEEEPAEGEGVKMHGKRDLDEGEKPK